MTIISDLRKSKNLSLSEVAQRLNKTPGYLSHLETGRRAFNEELIREYARAIGESEDLVYEKVSQMKDILIDVRSWITGLKIHNQPVMSAFERYLEVEVRMKGKKINKNDLRYFFAEFIEKNIASAILEEFDRDENLNNLFKERFSHLL